MELAIQQGTLAQALAWTKMYRGGSVTDPDAGPLNPLAGRRVQQENGDVGIPESVILQAFDDTTANLVFVQGGSQGGAEAEQGGLPAGLGPFGLE
jgi:hypothetical protein